MNESKNKIKIKNIFLALEWFVLEAASVSHGLCLGHSKVLHLAYAMCMKGAGILHVNPQISQLF